MSSLFRPILATLLCSMIVLGHAPAWLHVVHCEGHGHASFGVASNTSAAISICSYGCHHHVSPLAATETVPHSQDSSNHHQHDSDSCAICQSLASPSGVTWELLVSLPAEFVSYPVATAAELRFPAILLSIPQPRGPPVVA